MVFNWVGMALRSRGPWLVDPEDDVEILRGVVGNPSSLQFAELRLYPALCQAK